MLNFIVVDDNLEILKKVENIIGKLMINESMEYKIHSFSDYDSKFNRIINKPMSNKIYILDIETKSASGIDIARKIRKDDIDSVIMFITAHEELGSVIIKESLMVLTFICKFDDFDKKLSNALKQSLKIVGNKKVIRFNDYNSIYTISIKDILYITRDSVERKSIIVTDYTTYKVTKSLTELNELASDSFIQTHRACFVNKDRVSKIDKSNKLITFDNGITIDLLSDNYKKELV